MKSIALPYGPLAIISEPCETLNVSLVLALCHGYWAMIHVFVDDYILLTTGPVCVHE